MKRFAQTVLLKDDPEIIRQYEHFHAHQWPEVRDSTLRCGVERVFIYRFGRQLFMFMETCDEFDLERDMPKYLDHPKTREWDELMRSFQECVPGAPAGSTWVEMREIFALDKHQPAGSDAPPATKPEVVIKRSGLVYTDRVAVITGAAKGIGEGCARVFLDAGAHVVAIDQDAEASKSLEGELNRKGPGTISFVIGSVANADDIERTVKTAIEKHGRIDCLINNAGIHPPHAPIDDVTLEEFLKVVGTNLTSCFLGCKAALPYLRQTKGSVINVGSLVAEIGQELAVSYCATKGGVLAFTKSLAIEEARYGVRVNCIQPGNVFSNSMLELLQTPEGRAYYEWITKNQHVGRVGTNEEIGQVCLFLASDAAEYLTGISINCSAGAELGYGTKFPLLFAKS